MWGASDLVLDLGGGGRKKHSQKIKPLTVNTNI
jgi:hypothetical protein